MLLSSSFPDEIVPSKIITEVQQDNAELLFLLIKFSYRKSSAFSLLLLRLGNSFRPTKSTHIQRFEANFLWDILPQKNL